MEAHAIARGLQSSAVCGAFALAMVAQLAVARPLAVPSPTPSIPAHHGPSQVDASVNDDDFKIDLDAAIRGQTSVTTPMSADAINVPLVPPDDLMSITGLGGATELEQWWAIDHAAVNSNLLGEMHALRWELRNLVRLTAFLVGMFLARSAVGHIRP